MYGQVAQQKRSPEPVSHSSTSSRLAHVGQKVAEEVVLIKWTSLPGSNRDGCLHKAFGVHRTTSKRFEA